MISDRYLCIFMISDLCIFMISDLCIFMSIASSTLCGLAAPSAVRLCLTGSIQFGFEAMPLLSPTEAQPQ